MLQGALNPLEGIGPEQLRIGELVARIEREGITEVVLCHQPQPRGRGDRHVPGQAVGRSLPVRVTRLASGLPVGGDLEYADEMTLGRALEGRRELRA